MEEENNKEITEKKNNKRKIIIFIVIAIVLGALVYGGIKLKEWYDEKEYQKYMEAHQIVDNKMLINCEFDEEEDNIIICRIDTKDETNKYREVLLNVSHSSKIKYLSHRIPLEEQIHNDYSGFVTSDKKIRDEFDVQGLQRCDDLEYILEIKYEVIDDDISSETLSFDTLWLLSHSDDIFHRTEDRHINLIDLPRPEKKENSDEIKKYLCLNKDINKDEIVYKNMFTECDGSEELSKSAISEELLNSYGLKLADSYTDTTYYIKDNKKEKDIINIEDIYWRLEPLTNKELTSQVGEKFTLSTSEDKKLYLNESEIFNTEEVKEFYIRSYCCSGEKKIILVTEDNNIYITDKYLNYGKEKIEFKKLDLTNIKEFHVNYYVPSMAGTHVYAIDNEGKEHLID